MKWEDAFRRAMAEADTVGKKLDEQERRQNEKDLRRARKILSRPGRNWPASVVHRQLGLR